MMIRFSFQYRERPIELLSEDEPHHLMRERHLREADFRVGTVVDLLREAVGAADDEDEAFAACIHLTFKPLRETA